MLFRSKTSIPRDPIMSDAATVSYVLALTDPFHPGAVGARVPDMYAAPTATYTIRASHTVTVNSSGTAGFVGLPNAVCSSYLYNGSSPDFSPILYGDGTSVTSARWGASATNLAAKLDNYRIVGYGIQVTNLSSMTNTSGKFLMGAYPIDSNWVSKDFTVGGIGMATDASYTSLAFGQNLGIPYGAGSVVAANQWVDYPGTKVRSALEMGENVFGITAKPVDPRAFEFIGATDGIDGFDVINGSVRSGNADFLRLCGHEAVFCHLTGGVPSVSSFDVEIIYHIEGRPNVSGASQSSIIVPSTIHPSPVNPLGFMKAVQYAVSQPSVKEVIEYGANFIHPLLGKVAKGVLSLF